jgi:flagellar assembly factor FliW
MAKTMESQKSTFVTARFGEVAFVDSDVIEFPWGIPGFASLRRFLALSLAEQPNFVWLQSLDDASVALPTTDPWQIFPSYDPRLPGYASAALDLQQPDDFTILCVVVVTKDAKEMTVNLMAPIIVNLKTRRARQVMLENSGYSVREAMPRKATAETAQPA